MYINDLAKTHRKQEDNDKYNVNRDAISPKDAEDFSDKLSRKEREQQKKSEAKNTRKDEEKSEKSVEKEGDIEGKDNNSLFGAIEKIQHACASLDDFSQASETMVRTADIQKDTFNLSWQTTLQDYASSTVDMASMHTPLHEVTTAVEQPIAATATTISATTVDEFITQLEKQIHFVNAQQFSPGAYYKMQLASGLMSYIEIGQNINGQWQIRIAGLGKFSERLNVSLSQLNEKLQATLGSDLDISIVDLKHESEEDEHA